MSASLPPLRAIALQIARKLFTNGAQERAERLVLTIDKPVHRDLGGWSFDAAVRTIERAINAEALTGAQASDVDLLRRAVTGSKAPGLPRWAAVKRTFGCGATLARDLCRRFGLDPDEEIPKRGRS